MNTLRSSTSLVSTDTSLLEPDASLFELGLLLTLVEFVFLVVPVIVASILLVTLISMTESSLPDG